MSNITFRNEFGPGVEVLRIAKEGIWANPDVPVDQAAHAVLAALDSYIKELVKKTVEAEREACAQLCLETEPFYGVMFAEAIRARGEK